MKAPGCPRRGLFVVRYKRKNKLAFTLVELVVTIAIIGILAGIFVPSILSYAKMARMEGLNNDARTVFLAAQNYLTGWTGGGNDAAAINPQGETVDLDRIVPGVPAKEKTENGENIKYLTLARTDGSKQENPLYQILSGYISDQLLLEKSILVEYNQKTGRVRSAFVSEEPFLGYAGENSDPTNVYDRTTDVLWAKEQGYYGVDYTGSLPDRQEGQSLSVRIVNSDNMLRVECDIADFITAKNGTQYEFQIFSLDDPGKGYTFTFDPNLTYDRDAGGKTVWAVTYNNAKTAIEKADPKKPMVYKTEVDPDGTGHIVLILDVFSAWNAYDSARDMGIAACYPDLPVGLLDAKVTAKAADTGAEIAAERSGNTEYSYFAGQEKGKDGSVTYIIRDARQLNNMRYMTEGTAITGKFRQAADISMRAFFDETGDKVLAEGARVTIAPLGSFAGTYDAQKPYAGTDGDGNYTVTDLMVASRSGQAGLFAVNSGKITNLTVMGAQVGEAGEPVKTNGGIIAGANAPLGTIENCNVSGAVTGGASAGGIAGANSGKIIGCKSGVFPGLQTANAVQYTYKNTYSYTEKVLKDGKPVTVKKELPCVISSGGSGERNAAVGGIAGTNTGTITQCVNISQIENQSAGGKTGGLAGLVSAGGLTESYNAGRVVSTGNGSSVGGVVGQNGAHVEACYNTGRINLKDSQENNPGESTPLTDGSIGGVAGYNTESGSIADCYAINYIGYSEWQANTAAGGVIGRDETTDPAFVTNCSFIPGENLTNALGESVLGARGGARAVYRPEELADYYTGDPWRLDDPASGGTFYYRYPYLYGLKSEQITPWEQITPATPTLLARMENGELLTAEWVNETSSLQKGIIVEFLDGSGNVLDTVRNIDLEALRGITSLRDALLAPLSGDSGRTYFAFCEDNTYKIVLDGVLMDENRRNTIENYFRDKQSIGIRVTYLGEETVLSNMENPLYAGVTDEGNQISNARHFYNVRYRAGQAFVQAGNIELHNFDGTEAVISPVDVLTGSYDGKGYSITRLSVVSESGGAGLFAQIGEASTAKNIVLESGTVTGRENIGGIAGINYGTVSGCTVRQGVTVSAAAGGGKKNIGGLVGKNAGVVTGPDRHPTADGDNYLHTTGAQWYAGGAANTGTITFKTSVPPPESEGSRFYVAFDTLDATALGIPDGRQDEEILALLELESGYPFQLCKNDMYTPLTLADLQGMQKAKEGYYLEFYLQSDDLAVLRRVTDTPCFVGNSGEITDCVNEASLTQAADTANAEDRIGGIAGSNESVIRRCTSGTVADPPSMDIGEILSNATQYRAQSGFIGGVSGVNSGEITDCVNAAGVSSAAGKAVGGIAGQNTNLIGNCYNAGTVWCAGTGGSVGGIAGKNIKEITNCYNTGRINVEPGQLAGVKLSGGSIGGVAGFNGAAAQVSACYNIGYVGDAAGTGSAGGVVGRNENMAAGSSGIWNIYTLATNSLGKDAVGSGVPSGFPNTPVSADELKGLLLGTAFSTDQAPLAQTYQYPYPYLKGGAAQQRTPWEDAAEAGALKGSGASGDPYQIWNAKDLLLVEQYSEAPDKYFRQMDDIDMTGVDYSPIASFTGHYDGAGHTISNLEVRIVDAVLTEGQMHYTGGLVQSSNGNLRNICLVNPQVAISYTGPKYAWPHQLYVGGIVGRSSGRVEDCMVIGGSVTVTVEAESWNTDAYIGGIVGYGGASFCGCTADITLDNKSGSREASYLGGVAGYSYGSGVNQSYFAGTLSGAGVSAKIGAIAGYNISYVTSCVMLGGSAPQAVGFGSGSAVSCTSGELSSNDILGKLGGGAWHFIPACGYPYPLSVDITTPLPGISVNMFTEEEPSPEPEAQEAAPGPEESPEISQPAPESAGPSASPQTAEPDQEGGDAA